MNEFKSVVRKVLGERGIDGEEADEIALRVMNLFGYDKTLTDNILSTEERDFFYMLEDYDILTTEEETVTLPSGKHWRIHYWRIKEGKIRELLEEDDGKVDEREEHGIYEKIYDDIWERVEER